MISDIGEIIAGHDQVETAKLLGLEIVPCLKLSHLSEAKRRAYVLAENAGWDQEILAIELQSWIDLDFDLKLTGFAIAEIDLVMDAAVDARPDRADMVPAPPSGLIVAQIGDLWLLGEHRLLCGDARSLTDVHRLVGDEPVNLMFTDPPDNVAVDGQVIGLGKHQHLELPFASGEMSVEAYAGAIDFRSGGLR